MIQRLLCVSSLAVRVLNSLVTETWIYPHHPHYEQFNPTIANLGDYLRATRYAIGFQNKRDYTEESVASPNVTMLTNALVLSLQQAYYLQL